MPEELPPGPYLDYWRALTDEGSILIIYKGFDERWRHLLWGLFAWFFFSGAETWLVTHLPGQNARIRVWLIVAVFINLLIVLKPVEMNHRLEIRPDCMILDGTDLFWAGMMEDYPAFKGVKKDEYSLYGIYGTRFVEFLTLRRLDEFDRTPEVFNTHLKQAIQQLWIRPV